MPAHRLRLRDVRQAGLQNAPLKLPFRTLPPSSFNYNFQETSDRSFSAVSRLFLQVSTYFSGFWGIYTFCTFLHRSNLRNSTTLCKKGINVPDFATFTNHMSNCHFSDLFGLTSFTISKTFGHFVCNYVEN